MKMDFSQPRNLDRLWFALFSIAFLILQWMDYRVAFYFEESRDWMASIAVAHGHMPIVHFKWLYGPVLPVFLGILQFFHPLSITDLRLVHIVFGWVTMFAGFRICRFWFSSFTSALIAFCAVGHFQSLIFSYTHWFFSMFAMLTLWMLCKVFKEQNASMEKMITLGLCLALCFWTKPVPTGVAILGCTVFTLGFAFYKKTLELKWLKVILITFGMASLPWLPFHLLSKEKDGLQMIFDTAKGILGTSGRVGGFAWMPASSEWESWSKQLISFFKSEVFHLYFSIAVYVLAAAIAFRMRKKNARSAIELFCLLAFAASFNLQAFLHPLVHFSDAGAGYSLPLTIMLLMIALRTASSRKWLFLGMACIMVWTSLFWIRHPMRAYRSQSMVQWNDGGMKGVYVSKSEASYFKEVQTILHGNDGRVSSVLLLGYFPSFYAIMDMKDVCADDVFAAQRAFDVIYENSSVRIPTQKRIQSALESDQADVVFLMDRYKDAFQATSMVTVLNEKYEKTGVLASASPFPEWEIYVRRRSRP